MATIEYIQNVVAGKSDAKDAVQAIADTNVALTGSAPFVVDDYTFGTTTPVSRVLLTGQTSGADNGIYDVNISGSTYTLTRSPDFDESIEVTNGAYTRAVFGTKYQGFDA